MASSNTNQTDINERRLRPVYEHLDSGCNKKAIQEVDKLLKKNKKFPCAKVLKALALQRMGKKDECVEILNSVHSEHPTDESVLHAMCVCYRENHQWERIVDMYENACKIVTDSEDNLTALFMAYVRLRDYKKQQHIAMTLHKLRPNKNPYYFWAIMSIVMQAKSADSKLRDTMFLPLAERMVLKYVNTNKMDSESEVQLYIIILELMGKQEELVTTLEGPLGDKLMKEGYTKYRHLAQIYMDLGKYDKANALWKSILYSLPDDWMAWKSYLKSSLCLIKNNQNESPVRKDNRNVDDSVEKVLTFMEHEKNASGNSLRGPHLARLELLKLLETQFDVPITKSVGNILQIMIDYFSIFGHKLSTFSDLSLYLPSLTESQQNEFVAGISANMQDRDENGSPIYFTTVKDINRHVAILQFTRFSGHHSKLTVEERSSLSGVLYQYYYRGLDLGRSLTPTDLQYSDNYLLLSCHLLIENYSVTWDSKYLWSVVSRLEMGLLHSASDAQFKLLLQSVYGRLGILSPSLLSYESLEVKHIMNDSLGWTVFNHAVRLGQFSSSFSMYSTIYNFFTSNHTEIPEYIIMAYKYGAFHKINELLDLRQRLNNSLQFRQVATELCLLELMESDSHARSEQILSQRSLDIKRDLTEDVCDNRDLTVMYQWEPHLNIDKIRSESLTEELAWLRLRELRLRLLDSCLSLPTSLHHDPVTNGTTSCANCILKTPATSVIETHYLLYENHIQSCLEKFMSPSEYTCYGPFRSRLSSFLSTHDLQIFPSFIQLVLSYVHFQHSSSKEDEDKIVKNVRVIVESFNAVAQSIPNDLLEVHKEKCSVMSEVLELWSLLTELICHSVLIIGVLHKLLRPNDVKQNRKKTHSSIKPKIVALYRDVCSCVENAATKLLNAVQSTTSASLSINLSKLSLVPVETLDQEDCWAKVLEKVANSLEMSATQIAKALNCKLQYLASIKL